MQDLHPILVHVPVVSIPLAALFGLWLLLNRRNQGIRSAFRVCLVVAALFAFFAMVTGNRAEEHAEDVVPQGLLEQHEEFGTITFWLILAAAVVELASLVPQLKPRAFPLSSLAFVISLAAMTTVAIAGHHGAEMVYQYGAGVGHVFTAPAEPVSHPAADSLGVHRDADED